MKIYRRVRTWIMLAIMLIIPLGISLGAMALEADPDMWFFSYLEAEVVLSLVTIFAVIIAADSVAGEFSTGTIKLLLIRPWSRSKILLSKYISLLLFILFFTVSLFCLRCSSTVSCSEATASTPIRTRDREATLSICCLTTGLT